MKIVSVRPDELRSPELARWRSFQESDPAQDSPFLAPEFTMAVGAFRPNVRVAVVSEDNGDVVAFFPYERSALGIGQPVGTGFCDRHGIVHARGAGVDARQLLRACDLVVWRFEHLVPDQPVTAPWRARQFSSPVIDLSVGFDAYIDVLQQRSSTTLRGINYKRRRLEREVGEVRHVMHSTDPAALRTLMAWKSVQYQRTGRRDLFADPGFSEFVERLHQTDSERFKGSLSLLYAGDRLVAGHFGMHTPTVLALWSPAYDVVYSRYSPGLIQMMALSSDAAGLGIRTFDLGRSKHDYKDQLKTGHLHVYEGWLARPSVAAASYHAVAAPWQDLRNFIRARPDMRKKAIAVREKARALRARSNLSLRI